LQPGEECDDGNVRNGDGCNRYCKLENGYHGDDILETALNEECDLGDLNGQPGADCNSESWFVKLHQCSNGVVDPLSEQCDYGQLNGNYAGAPCRENCMLPRCGDGILDPNEECDDGNNLDSDGCNADCTSGPGAAPPIYYTANINNAGFNEGQLNIRTIPTPARQPTGPGLVIFLASGAAAGVGLVRKRLRGK
jgi:cysteine-rich repeat protein